MKANGKSPTLFTLSGLPGTGKTTIARELARVLRAVYFRVDSAENALKNSSLKISPAEDAGYEIGYAMAIDNLMNGLDFVADCVNPIQETRSSWQNAAQTAKANYIGIEIICSDPEIHKARLLARNAQFPELNLPDWNDVLNRRYEAWDTSNIVIDTAVLDVQSALNRILELKDFLETQTP